VAIPAESISFLVETHTGENLTNGRPSPSLKMCKGLLFLEEAMREKEEEEKAKEGER
jgi:hypothetical protein